MWEVIYSWTYSYQFLNQYDCVLEFSAEFAMSKIVMDLQKIPWWFSYDVVITCVAVPEVKLENIRHGREGPGPCPSLDIKGQNFKTPNASAHQIEQVERATQSITDHLVEHVNWQVGWLEAIVFKNTSLNNKGQQENRYDWYCPIDVAWEVVGPTDKWTGFHSKPPKLSIFSRE